VSGVDNLGGANCSQVAVTLIGEDYLVGICPFHTRSHGWCSAVRYLYHIDVNVIILQHRASYRRYTDGDLAYVKLIDNLGNQSMSNTVPASGAVMRCTIFDSNALYNL
jgi:hypothetical protein